MSFKRTTNPATEPVSLTEAKLFLRVDGTDDDTLITSLILAARQKAETFLQKSLITQTWTFLADKLPAKEIPLRHEPLQSVTSITTYDDSDVGTVYASSNYYVDTSNSRIKLRSTSTSLSGTRVLNAYEIIYITGYGAATDVPDSIKQGILHYIAFLYENRENSGTTPTVIKDLWSPYRKSSL